MHAYSRVLVVIQAGAAQLLVVKFKTQGADQMQLCAGIGAQTDDVAGVRRDLGLVKNDIEHARILIAYSTRTGVAAG